MISSQKIKDGDAENHDGNDPQIGLSDAYDHHAHEGDDPEHRYGGENLVQHLS